MKAVTVLKKTLALFDDADKWVQEYYAAQRVGKGHGEGAAADFYEDNKGIIREIKKPNCYCLVGGLRKVARIGKENEDTVAYHDATNKLQEAIGETDIECWNDQKSRTIGQVRSALKKAIKLAEAA